MKRLFVICAALWSVAVVRADDYAYLSVVDLAGGSASFASSGAKIVFADGMLVVTSGDVSGSFDLSTLDYMVLTNTVSEDNTLALSGQSVVGADVRPGEGCVLVTAEEGARVCVYSSGGMEVAAGAASGKEGDRFGDGLQRGVYVVSVNGVSTKIVLK